MKTPKRASLRGAERRGELWKRTERSWTQRRFPVYPPPVLKEQVYALFCFGSLVRLRLRFSSPTATFGFGFGGRTSLNVYHPTCARRAGVATSSDEPSGAPPIRNWALKLKYSLSWYSLTRIC
jgi:hypothetical protein